MSDDNQNQLTGENQPKTVDAIIAGLSGPRREYAAISDTAMLSVLRGPYGGWFMPCACDGFSFGHEPGCGMASPPDRGKAAAVRSALIERAAK